MKRFLIQLTACIIGFIAHFIYESWDIYRAASKFGGAPFGDYLTTYTDRFQYLNGLTTGLLISFILYIVTIFTIF